MVSAAFQDKPFPPFPNTQALNSTTFVKPPLDGSLNISQMFDFHEENSPTHPLVTYPIESEGGKLRTINWKEAAQAVRRGAKVIRDQVDASGVRESTKWKVPMVAIVSAADTVTYLTAFVAVQRANCILFVISPRNSPAAVAHLMNKVSVDHLIVGREPSMKSLVAEAIVLLKTDYPGAKVPDQSPMLTYDDLYLSSTPAPPPSALPLSNTRIEDLAMYFHSSGSTNFPKPTAVSNKKFIEFANIAFWGDQDMCGQTLALQVMPIYHGMGAVQIMFGAITGLSLSCFEPRSPAIVPTAENFLDGVRKTNSQIVISVPTFVEAWAKDEEAIKWLGAHTNGIIYGGGPLNREAGDILAKAGVNIFSMYGTIEAGTISSLLPAASEPDWAYIPFSGCLRIEMRHHYDEYYELVVVSGPFNTPSVVNTTSRGLDANGVEKDLDAYATGDLWIEHPERKGTWRIYGRTDDQIMHSTGEKTNPGPLESMMNQDPHVQTSIMFGRGRFQAGIIIDPKPEYAFDPADEVKLGEFRNMIWPTVERMNEYAPQHSRLFKEMILVISPSKPITYTSKNTPRRQATVNEYEPEINALYDAVENSSSSLVPPPAEFTPSTTLSFTRAVVYKILQRPIFDGPEGDDKDLFEHGCDSLQATWVRNTLLKGLREQAGKRGLDVRSVGDGVVYRHPRVKLLADWAYNFISPASNGANGHANGLTAGRETDEEKVKKMEDMVKKYTAALPALTSTPRHTASEKVVLLTGTTGGLGSNTLAVLMGDPSVKRVYALNRSGKGSVADRQRQAFEERGLAAKVDALEGGKVVLLEADTSSANFGLDAIVLDEIKSSVTHIIHNAWRVDFNLALSSFETNVKGVRNLVDLALTVGARVLFISSVGCLQNAPPGYPMTEAPVPAQVALGNGYAEGKWVSEQLLSAASAERGLSVMNIRIGQLAGGINGNWTTKEWFPTIVQSAKVLGCLPSEEGKEVGWIQAHVAAQAVVDYLDASTAEDIAYTHVTHPNPASFSSLLPAFTKPLGASIVPFAEWLAKLEEYAKAHAGENDIGEKLPATRLLEFYRETGRATGNNREAFGLLKLENKQAVKASKRLQSAPKMDAYEAMGWVAYWQSAGLL